MNFELLDRVIVMTDSPFQLFHHNEIKIYEEKDPKTIFHITAFETDIFYNEVPHRILVLSPGGIDPVLIRVIDTCVIKLKNKEIKTWNSK